MARLLTTEQATYMNEFTHSSSCQLELHELAVTTDGSIFRTHHLDVILNVYWQIKLEIKFTVRT